MLEVTQLSAAYGQHPALNDVAIRVEPGEIVVILGANGAGKSSLLRAISGICAGKVTGQVALNGRDLRGMSSDEIVEQGVALVPEGRGIFGDLTVKENLLLGAYPARARAAEAENLARVLQLFPKLQERQGQIARTMSGGEQQMVAIGRAMMSAPDILMLDEPSLGLSPLLCKELFQNLAHVKDLGIGVLLVEQNAKQSLAIADRGYLLNNTRVTHEDSAERLIKDPAVQKAYLGAGAGADANASVGASGPKSAPQPAATPDRPATPQVSGPATPRRSADQQLGISIDDLVTNAAKISAQAPRAAPAQTAQTTQAARHLAQSRVEVLLKDIESAALAARTRRAKPAPNPGARSEDPGPISGAPPPVIEVYRKPKVEVYRRRPSGEFERG